MIILVITFLVIVLFNVTIKIFISNLNAYLETYLDNFAQKALNDAIIDVTHEYDFEVSAFVRVTTTASGNTAYLETDTISVNEFKSKVSNKIIESLSKDNKKIIKLRILNMLGNTYWINRGPAMEVVVFPVGSAVSDLNSSFSDAGVNQTMHELSMSVKIQTKVVFPFCTVKRSGEASVPISNTVIVGEVPDSYVNVTSDPESVKGDVLQLAGE